jgi:hypothetical protein
MRRTGPGHGGNQTLDHDKAIREQLVRLLTWEDAHVGFDRAIERLPVAVRGQRANGMAHSVWQIVEHLRIAQRDILEFSVSANYKELKWPDQYWPASAAPPNDAAWKESVRSFHRDRDTFCGLLTDPSRELFVPFEWGSGQTLMREALLIADHNAYHVGEIVAARRALGAWE